jgi:hypothetical protein
MTTKLRSRRTTHRGHGRVGGRPVWLRSSMARLAFISILVATQLLLGGSGGYAVEDEPAEPAVPTVTSVDQVIDNVRLWLLGILAAWATLCLTVGFIRYTSGDPGEVEKGKLALRNAAIGYAGALLAPLLVTIIGQWVVG